MAVVRARYTPSESAFRRGWCECSQREPDVSAARCFIGTEDILDECFYMLFNVVLVIQIFLMRANYKY
jgi:hypothetical protein